MNVPNLPCLYIVLKSHLMIAMVARKHEGDGDLIVDAAAAAVVDVLAAEMHDKKTYD
jgi:hypothetical protein